MRARKFDVVNGKPTSAYLERRNVWKNAIVFLKNNYLLMGNYVSS